MGELLVCVFGKKGIFRKITERFIAGFLCPTIAMSFSVSRIFEMTYHKPINSVIPVGIDIDKINADSPSSEESDIIFVGRLVKEKNAELLVNAVALALLDIRISGYSLSEEDRKRKKFRSPSNKKTSKKS